MLVAMSIGLSHLEEANKGVAHHNINIANKLYEAEISVEYLLRLYCHIS